MNKSVKLRPQNWNKISEKLRQDYPLSVLAISWKTKEVLGFSVRSEFDVVHLDFVDEKKKTLFLLKYSDYVIRPKASNLQRINEILNT